MTEAQTKLLEDLRSGAVRLVPVEALDLVLDNVGWDEGPHDEGWKSKELQSAEKALSQPSPDLTPALVEMIEGLVRERDAPFPADGEWLSMEQSERRNTFEEWARTTPLPLHMAESGIGRFYADDRTEWAWQTFALCGGTIAKAEREADASGRAHQAMTDRWLSAKAEIETLQIWLSGQRERGDFYSDLAEKAEARALVAEAERDALREALAKAQAWHESEDKALSKSGRSDADYHWRRLQHREQLDAIKAALPEAEYEAAWDRMNARYEQETADVGE